MKFSRGNCAEELSKFEIIFFLLDAAVEDLCVMLTLLS